MNCVFNDVTYVFPSPSCHNMHVLACFGELNHLRLIIMNVSVVTPASCRRVSHSVFFIFTQLSNWILESGLYKCCWSFVLLKFNGRTVNKRCALSLQGLSSL